MIASIFAALRDDVQVLFQQFFGLPLGDIDAKLFLRELMLVAMKHRIRVPSEYALLIRAGTTIEGLIRDLDPDLDIAAIARPYAEQLILERVSPENIEGGLYRALLQFQGLSHDLPIQLSQIVSDLASSRLGVRMSGRALDNIPEAIHSAAVTIALSVLSSAFWLGGFALFAQTDEPVEGTPLLGIVCVALGIVFTVLLFMHVLVRPRLKKISLARLLGTQR